MRIAQIMFSDGWGGAERLFVELCEELCSRGHHVLIVCKPHFDRCDMLSKCDKVTIIKIPACCNLDYFSLLKLKKTVKLFAPDLIHAHLTRASWMSGHVGQLLKIPTISTTHNRIKLKYIRKIGYFTTITTELLDYLCGIGISREKCRKIPNFSSVPPVYCPSAERHKPVTFLALGRFVHKKGFDILLRAFKEFLERSPVPGRLIIAGDGPMRHDLVTLATGLSISEFVKFVGWIDDVPQFFEQGDVFVLPSRDEPFGIVLLEAMASGTAIIATYIGGPRDFLTDEEVFFVEPENVGQLCAVMQQAATDASLCLFKAQRSLQHFRRDYTKDAVIPMFEEWYKYVVQNYRSESNTL